MPLRNSGISKDTKVIVVKLEKLFEAKKRRLPDKEAKNFTWETVSKDTGITYGTILRWKKNQLDRADFSTLDRLCEYFDCEVGDVLERER